MQDNRTKQLEEDKDRLVAQIIAAEEAISYREDQIKEKCQQNEALKMELETIPVLKAQVSWLVFRHWCWIIVETASLMV